MCHNLMRIHVYSEVKTVKQPLKDICFVYVFLREWLKNVKCTGALLFFFFFFFFLTFSEIRDNFTS